MTDTVMLEWVSYPHLSTEVIGLLQSDQLLVVQSGTNSLPTGAKRYYYLVRELSPNSPLEKIRQKINRISFQPLVFTFNLVSIPLLQQRKYAEGLENILIAYLRCYRSWPVVEFQHNYLENPATLLLRPITDEGLSIYLSENERESLMIISKELDQLVGYDLLSGDPLVWYYLPQENIISSTWWINVWREIAIIPLDPPPEQEPTSEIARQQDWIIEPENREADSTIFGQWSIDREKFKEEIFLLVSSLRRDNYFSYLLRTEASSRVAFQLAQQWPISYWGQFSSPTNPWGIKYEYLVLSSDRSFDVEVASWFERSIQLIRTGYLPIYYWGGEWTQYVNPTLDNMARLQYAATRAYYQMARKFNQTLIDFIWQVKVLPNLTIAAYFHSWDELDNFRQVFESFLPNTRNWLVIESPDLLTAARRSYSIRQEMTNQSLMPLVVSIPANPSVYYLVVNKGLEPFNPSFNQMPPADDLASQSESALRGLPDLQKESMILNPSIGFVYYPDLVESYTFTWNDVPMFTLKTSQPVEIVKQIKQNPFKYLSAWGESCLRKNPQTGVISEFFNSKVPRIESTV